MTPGFSEERSAAIRTALVAEVTATPRARPRWWRAVGLVAAGALVGAGAATAAFAAGTGAPATPPAPSPTASGTDGLFPAPPGVEPGSPIVSMLGSPTHLVVTKATSLDIRDRPEAATHARITITCLAAGRVSFGTDPGGNNSSVGCSAADLAPRATGWQDFEITEAVDTLYFDTSRGGSASVSVQFLNQVPTRFGVNARGQTYGVAEAPQGEPDLVWVSGVDANGNGVLGYALSSDLHAFAPDHPAEPTSPAEAVRLQAERDQKYPDGWDVPVYESDGVTRIGSFHVG
jgi:hypothetical protein